MNKCGHCGLDLGIRNPSGKCDHLYYPENCNTCSGRPHLAKPQAATERARKGEEGK